MYNFCATAYIYFKSSLLPIVSQFFSILKVKNLFLAITCSYWDIYVLFWREKQEDAVF